MHTRTALSLFTGGSEIAGPTSDPAFVARYKAAADQRTANIEASRQHYRFSHAHVAAAAAQAAAADGVDAVMASSAPLIDNFTAYKVAAAAMDAHPSDIGVKVVLAAVKRRWEKNALGQILVGEAAQLRKMAHLRAGARTVVGEVFDEFARRGNTTLDTRRLANLAKDISDQASFDAVVRRAGLHTNQPGHVQARAFLAHIVNAGTGHEEHPDPFDVTVIEQQPAAMSGPKAGDGGAALAADSMKTAKKAILEGRSVRIGKALLRTTANATVELVVGNRVVARGGLGHIESLLRRASDIYEPRVNEQQPPGVDISPEEGGGVLGQDSQVEDLGPDPKVNQQVDPLQQPGTSTGVAAMLVCAACKHTQQTRIEHVPAWVASPALWNGMYARLARRGRVTYPALVKAYNGEAAKLRMTATKAGAVPATYRCGKCNATKMHLLAEDGGRTLGPDQQTKEPGWTPTTDAHPNKPTGPLPNKGEALEPDHQQDESPVMDPGKIETSRLGPTAGRVSPNLTAEKSPGQRYIEALRSRPGERLVREAMAAGAVNDAAKLLGDGEARWRRFAFTQKGTPDMLPDGSFTYKFTFKASAGAPTPYDLQEFLHACNKGDWNVVRAHIGEGVIDAIVGDGKTFRNASMEEKRSRVASAMHGSDKGNDGGVGMASDYNDGLMNVAGEGCPECGAADSTYDEARDAKVCASCGSVGSPDITAETTSPVPPVDPAPTMPKGFAPSGAAIVGPYGAGFFAVRTASAPHTLIAAYPTRRAALSRAAKGPSGAITVRPLTGGRGFAVVRANRVFATTWTVTAANKLALTQSHRDWRSYGEVVRGLDHVGVYVTASTVSDFFSRNPALTYVEPRSAAHIFLTRCGYQREAARIHEGWGEAGAFEREVEADSAEELWKLHKGLNGHEPAWPATPAAAPLKEDDLPMNPPGKVAPDNNGDPRLPAPEPEPMAGAKKPGTTAPTAVSLLYATEEQYIGDA